MKVVLYITVVATSLFFSRCAQQMAPSGGERDLYSPILDTNKVSPAVPENYSTSFTSSQITLHFNEYFKLENPTKNVIVTPIPATPPVYRISGKKLIIDLGEDLNENTTYTINFGTSIKDITEGNILKNFSYVFSTGAFIDSLSYSGKVYDAITKKGVGDATVMLYDTDNDSLPLTGKPMYFVKTNLDGSFTMEFLKSGKYKVVTVLDENNDYRYNSKNESIGFLDEQITLPVASEDSSENRIVLFKENVSKQFVSIDKYTYPGRINIVLNKPSDNLVVKMIRGVSPKEDYIHYSTNNDSIEIWLDSTMLKEESVSVSIVDQGNDFSDTLKIKLTEPKKETARKLAFSHNVRKGLDIGGNILLQFTTPLSSFDKSKVELVKNDVLVPFELLKTGGKEISIIAKWKEGAKYSINVYPGAFIDLFSTTTDTISKAFRCKSEKDYGNLSFTMETESGDYLFSLLKEGFPVVDTTFSGSTFIQTFKQLAPGNYSIKIVYDVNRNGKWDTGDYLQKIQPERIEYYSKEISIRSGWDMDVTWKIK